jgi:hypothetical protein
MQHRKTIQMPVLCALFSLACLLSASPSNAGADLSTPKKAAAAFFKAVETGDMDAVKATSTGTDDDYAAIKSISGMLVGMSKVQAAMVKKYGDDAKALGDLSAGMSTMVEESEVKMDGDTATLVNKKKPDDKYPPTLKKSGDEWKMDLKNMSQDPDFAKTKDMASKASVALEGLAKEIDDGKYPTFVEAAQALTQTMTKVGT